MVLTRSQAAKQKANESPQQHRQAAKKQAGGGDATAAAGQLPLADKPLNVLGGMAPKAAKLAHLRTGPASHPIASLPASPAASPGPAARGFTIAAVQQQQAAQLSQALAAVKAAHAEGEGSPADGPQQQSASEASSVERRQPASEGAPADDSAQQEGAAGPAAAAPQEEPAAPPQQPQPPAHQPRPEKLLKRLPDKPVPCDKLPDGPEPVVVEVEYVATADLAPLGEPAAAAAAVPAGLQAADWVEAVRALNVLRQLAAHHPETCAPQLGHLMPLVLNSVRSLRSSVCKTAIMAVADLYTAYGDALLPHTDVGGQAKPLTSLLAQLLLKAASNDKRFVVEEAQRALGVLVGALSPGEALGLLLPYADAHKNPRVRGKAAGAVAETVARMLPADLLAFGHPRLLRVAAKLVTDNTPDAREGAKSVIGLLKAAFADPEVQGRLAVEPLALPPAAVGDEPARAPSRWEAYCQATLTGSAALAVLKASSE